MTALHQSILSLGIRSDYINLKLYICLSYPSHCSFNLEQLTILLDHIQKLSNAVEEVYETSYHKPLALNNLELWWDPSPA
jgi:hypothetical protein